MFKFPWRPAAALLSRSALKSNLDLVRERLKNPTPLHAKGAKIMAVVKADAYGHRSSVFSPQLWRHGVRDFCVASLEEGLELRKILPRASILVLGGTLRWNKESFQLAQKNRLSVAINDLKSLSRASSFRSLQFHIKFDTGMNRLGLKSEDWGACIELLRKMKIQPEGIFTHFASFGENSGFLRQAILFEELVRWYFNEGLKAKTVHCENSSALFSQLKMKKGILSTKVNLVRPGIAIYGYMPKGFLRKLPLSPVLELCSELSLIKTVKKGEGISYDHLYRAKNDHQYAVVPLGYADGIAKEYSQDLEPLWYDRRGRKKGRLSLCGAICMDMLLLKSNGKPLEEQDRVSFWGDFPNRLIERAGVDPYELNLRIAPRIPRVWVP